MESNGLCLACRPTVKSTTTRKYALDGDAQEYRLPITDDDVSVDEFLTSNEGNILAVLESAINQHV
jgi:hypothetical protein